MNIKDKIGWKTAAGLVVANMIGTGVFTSLGFQVAESQNTWSIILLWLIGGMMALIGAFVYAELGTHFKKSGGDYIFLSRTINPSVGYLYAWISLTIGFPAPVAIASMAMVQYWQPLIGPELSLGMGVVSIIAMSIFHSFSVHQSGNVQNVLTGIKLLFVFSLIVIGTVWASTLAGPSYVFTSSWKGEILRPGFAVSLIYVFYAYTGWNSAAYIVEEIEQPRKNLPKALISATILVMVVYVLLQLIFLKHASIDQLSGKVQVATLAFGNIFGNQGIFWVSLFIGIQLIATISGYTWVGPRITNAMAKEFKLWRPLAKTNKNGIPVRAVWFNTLISFVLMLSGSFEMVLLYVGFVLQLMGTFTIASSLLVKNAEGFKSPFRPWLQIIYIIFSLWVMIFMFYDRPKESLIGMGIILIGFFLYRLDSKISKINN
ncbi:APC family permease [Cecembia calidifontis]|uniref:Amino acid/polyamine/organocation transporter (APC superfamily) n=1 Tax=Cecembia calidifontis TaxID=1187080 RepID=A0A4Q7PCD1_9BACT|nr:amino acid permease [Cecembia calidifontis]RZS97240.1 amino acid/polyamine/organocation transporter (APC superfamily) [Cecembia calidifontis]